MATVVSFPSQLFVGVRDERGINPTNPILGFATPYGVDSAGRKRMGTVTDWSGPTGVTCVLDNVLVEGFRLTDFVSRHSTDNKWFTVADPRGFKLQISSGNLVEIIKNCDLTKGELIGRYIWGREGSNMYLIHEDHQAYIDHCSPKVSRTKLEVGDRVRLAITKQEYIYVGQKYLFNFGVEQVDKTPMIMVNSPYSTSSSRQYAPGYNYTNRVLKNYAKYKRVLESVHVFIEVNSSNPSIYVTSTIGKNAILEEGVPFQVRGSYQVVNRFDSTKPINLTGAQLFDTLDEVKDVDVGSFDFVAETFAVWPHYGPAKDITDGKATLDKVKEVV